MSRQPANFPGSLPGDEDIGAALVMAQGSITAAARILGVRASVLRVRLAEIAAAVKLRMESDNA